MRHLLEQRRDGATHYNFRIQGDSPIPMATSTRDEVLVDVLLEENQQSTLFGLGITRQLHQIVFGNVNWLNVTILSKKM